jgi:putative ABC transport system ATP-binding protein
MELFSALNASEDITVVLVTHERDIARYARRVVNFIDGRIAYDGATASYFKEHAPA